MPTHILPFEGANPTLAQAVKMAGLAQTGGQAKQLIRSGSIRVNGSVDNRPGRKLMAGDSFSVANEESWILKNKAQGETEI
jgi:ribosome-associated protein